MSVQRFLLSLLLVCAACLVSAQTPTTGGATLFDTVRPDVIITIKKHPLGADLVEVSMPQENYPADLLRSQIAALGKSLGVEPRGVKLEANQVATGAQNLTFLKASFGIDGLIDRANGKVALQPIVRAFAGEHGPYTIKGYEIILDGENADPRNVRKFNSPAVDVEGIHIESPPGVEYRVLLKTTEPDKIFIPSWSGEQRPQPTQPHSNGTLDWTLYALLIVGAIAIGALVYSVLLRQPHPRAETKPKK